MKLQISRSAHVAAVSMSLQHATCLPFPNRICGYIPACSRSSHAWVPSALLRDSAVGCVLCALDFAANDQAAISPTDYRLQSCRRIDAARKESKGDLEPRLHAMPKLNMRHVIRQCRRA